MLNKKIILITGMSGAGKTTAMQILDDMGYHCIDQFPIELLNNLYELIEKDERYQNVCVSVNALEYPMFLNFFQLKNLKVQTIFLDSNNEQLILRYKFTRRQHPFLSQHIATTLEEAIQKERSLFSGIKNNSIIYIDTSKRTKYDLKDTLEKHVTINKALNFSISFVSFGYRYGIPADIDIAIDIRFLPNPYYNENLRYLTGNDKEVYNFVMEQEESKKLKDHLVTFFDYMIAQYEKDGRSHITIGIGCTGGKHRSVSFINYLFNHYSQNYNCFKKHRDIEVK